MLLPVMAAASIRYKKQDPSMQYIDVVIDNKSNNTDTFYTYSAPDEVEVGARLTVPFAGRKKPVDAYCVRTGVTPDFDPARI